MAALSLSRLLGLVSLSLLLFSSLGLARPKAAWMRGARTRLAKSSHLSSKSYVNGSACVKNAPADFQAPKNNVWHGLTDVETSNVTKWVFHRKELNLTVARKAHEWDNKILLVELMIPNKTDVLPYIDGGSDAPARYAHVVLDLRSTLEPTYTDILVGPLPIDNVTTTWEYLEYPYTRKTGGSIRNLDADYETQHEFLFNVSRSIMDITLDLWGGTALGLKNDTLDIWGIDPYWQYDGKITRWDTFWNYPTDTQDTDFRCPSLQDEFDAETLLPLGLFFKSDVTGRDPSKWKVEGWLYNDIFYETTEDFKKAYYSPGFKNLAPNVEGDWARTDQNGPRLPQDKAPPPQAVAPAAPRYSVDQKHKYVEWMDFSFYIGFTRDRGMALYDIRHKGQRILYELSLQEALAHYAGNDPAQSGVSYLDSYYGFGPYAFELVPGYDCPTYATYTNSTFYVDETTHTHINSICFFEFDADYPMQRHSTSQYVANTKNVYFVVRSVSTVGNYDYQFSYEFYLDGSIRVTVRASGYIQAAYYAHNEDYGYQIHDALSGSMHDHVLNYKADFDILGVENTMQLTTFTPATESYVWSDRPRKTMKVKRRFIESENASRLIFDSNEATQYRIVNTDKPNKYGEYRGYRILSADGTCHWTNHESSNLEEAIHPFVQDLAVTKQKDTEPRSCHPYNGQDIYNPMINFDEFFDGENLMQEDIVLWFNLGMHHLPHTGDLPNTVFTTAHSGVQFMPLNYYHEDISRESANMVRINYHAGNVSEVETFGQNEAVCSVDLALTDPDLFRYTGDVVIRKFPYDPNDPYFETDSIV